jgi:predicted metal-dependent hydrolase
MTLPENYKLERKRVRHARIRVSENLSVRVIVPEKFDPDDIVNLIKKKQKWIDKHLDKFKGRKERIALHNNQILLFGDKYNYLYKADLNHQVIVDQNSKTIHSNLNLLSPKEQLKWYKCYAKQYITQRITEIGEMHKFKYNRIFIRNQRTKWGNCSTKMNLSFNWRLIKTPYFVIDYLIYHELAHTRTMNHANKFWTELKTLYPKCQEAVSWLDKYGNSL